MALVSTPGVGVEVVTVQLFTAVAWMGVGGLAALVSTPGVGAEVVAVQATPGLGVGVVVLGR